MWKQLAMIPPAEARFRSEGGHTGQETHKEIISEKVVGQ